MLHSVFDWREIQVLILTLKYVYLKSDTNFGSVLQLIEDLNLNLTLQSHRLSIICNLLGQMQT